MGQTKAVEVGGQENQNNPSLAVIETAVKKIKDFQPVVKNQADYDGAGEALKKIKETQKRVEDFFNEDIEKAYELHRSLTGKKKAFLEPLKTAESQIKQARLAFENEQERLRKVEQDKLDAAARETERKAKEALENKAKKAQESGKPEKAEALLQQSAQTVVIAPQVQPKVFKTEGVTKITRWVARVTDLKALCLAVANGQVGPDVFSVNQGAINKLAAVNKSSVQVPGLSFYEETTERVSG